MQITAPISPGSSGGPLFNMAGEVVGITTMYIKGGENLNFAVPVNEAKRMLVAKSSKMQDFPNEPEWKEVQPEGTHGKATLLEQKMCSEQGDKTLQKNRLAEKDNVWRPTFHGVSHYQSSTGICYVEVSRSVAVPNETASEQQFNEQHFNIATRGASDGEIREFRIEDAFEGRDVGTFMLIMPYENNHPALCTIQPPGQPEIECKSEAEFHDLALKYFGIQK